MKETTFTPYLEVVPIHHFRYCIEIKSPASDECTSAIPLMLSEEPSVEWDTPDTTSKTDFELTVPLSPTP